MERRSSGAAPGGVLGARAAARRTDRAGGGPAAFYVVGLQSFWYDESFTPLHVLHPSLITMLESGAENRDNMRPLGNRIEWFE